MRKENEFDYIIIGGGLAGLQLALAFAKDIFFEDVSIAIIEPSDKVENDKSWSFWEKGEGNWESLIYHRWNKGLFRSKQKDYLLNLGDYQYKTIRSADFYAQAKDNIAISTNIVWIKDRVLNVESKNVIGELANYEGTKIFDSRVSKELFTDKKSITLQQHFKGLVIEIENPVFDPTLFTMMDYSIGFKNTCCFTYILPFSKTKALVEFTFFTPEVVEGQVYDELLEKYIREQLKVDKYKIIEQEQGNIPMSTFPFWKENTNDYLKIGTGGGWVKSSTGYSFKNTENKVAKILENLKFNHPIGEDLYQKKYIFYDKIFLNVLFYENHLGNQVFEEMYKNNSVENILSFLDEETTFIKELKIINNFSKPPFLRALKRVIS